jgi:hypothetical protein
MNCKFVDNIIIDQVEWDADYYGRHIPMKGVGDRKEDGLQKRYPARVKRVNADANADTDVDRSTSITRPCIIIDMHGRILCWYLPGVLSEGFQV